MNSFKELIKKTVNTPCKRLAFRQDKWGEVATVYFEVFAPISICVDFDKNVTNEELESFKHYVKHGSDKFVEEAKNCFGENWQDKVKHRKGAFNQTP